LVHTLQYFFFEFFYASYLGQQRPTALSNFRMAQPLISIETEDYNTMEPIPSSPESDGPEESTSISHPFSPSSPSSPTTQPTSIQLVSPQEYTYDSDSLSNPVSQVKGSGSPDKIGTTFNLDSDDSPIPVISPTFDDSGVKVTRSTYIFVMCAALNSCNLGYDIGVNTGAGKLLEESLGLSKYELEIFMGSLNLFAATGAICASTISDRFGRRGAFLVAAIGFIFGTLVQCFATSYATLMLGRVFVGLGVGFGLAIDPIYISEVSPAEHRGRLVTWSEIATNVGIVFGFSSGLIFYDVDANVAWRLMFSMGIILPSLLIFFVIKVMPESPRWLISKGRDEEAKVVLQTIYPASSDIDLLVKDIKNAIKREMAAENAVGWDMILFPTPSYRRMLLVGVGSAIAQQLVGIDAIQYFLDYILAEAGVEEGRGRIGILVGLGVLKLVVIVFAGRAFDKNGRRPLMFLSLFGLTVAVFILAATFLFEDLSASMGIIGLASYLSFFSLGMGPGAWLIPAEVFSTTIRAKAMSVATFMNRATGTIVTSSFFTLARLLTYSGFFILLGFINIGIMLFFYFMLPETKGRSLEDMSMYFAELTGDSSVLDAERRLQNSSKLPDDEPELPIGTLA